MAVPSYTEDLTDIDLAESGSTGTAVNLSGGGGAAPAFGIDLAMQGAGCWDRQVSSHERGIAFNQTPGAPVVATGVHIFQWLFVATPGITASLSARGAYILCGTSTGNIMQFHVEGSDTYGAAGRVGKCYPFRYVTTSNTGSIPYRTVNGSPGATPTYFGAGITTNASAKGSNLGVDAMRYGTGAYITAGDGTTPATFDGFATQNDSINNRWGILTKVGNSYELQGRFVIGQNNSKTPTACQFEDSDRNIVLVDTVHSETDFTQIIIDHASTIVDWTNISLTALGTNNPGRVVVNNASTSVTVAGGVWTDIGITTLRAGCGITGTTWRGAGQITGNGAQFTDCVIENNTVTTNSAAVIVSDIDQYSGGSISTTGTGHAIEVTSVAGGGSWTTDTSGYRAGTSGADVAYEKGVDANGNETIFVNAASGSISISVSGGAAIPSVAVPNGSTCTVSVTGFQPTLTLTGLVANSEVRIYTAGTTTELTGVENSGTTFAYQYEYVAATTVDIVVHKADYKHIRIEDYLLGSGDASLPIQQIFDRNYI